MWRTLHPVCLLLLFFPRPANAQPFGTMAAAPFGSSLILPISYAYISMMGSQGLTEASKLAILKANYMAKILGEHYPVLYTGGPACVLLCAYVHASVLCLLVVPQAAI